MVTKKVPDGKIFYECEKCQYITLRKSQYDRHIETKKHKNGNPMVTKKVPDSEKNHKKIINDNINDNKINEEKYEKNHKNKKVPDGFSNNICHEIDTIEDKDYYNYFNSQNIKEKKGSAAYMCSCGNEYKYKSGLARHKKICNFEFTNKKQNSEENNSNLENLVVQLLTENNQIKNSLIKENQELRQQINELIPRIGNNNNTYNTSQKFNVNLFLNEKCKDAMSIEQFVHNIEISLKNLLTTKSKGIGIGLSGN